MLIDYQEVWWHEPDMKTPISSPGLGFPVSTTHRIAYISPR